MIILWILLLIELSDKGNCTFPSIPNIRRTELFPFVSTFKMSFYSWFKTKKVKTKLIKKKKNFIWSTCQRKGNQHWLCPILCDPKNYWVHGVLQARILEWAAVPFSRGSSQPTDWSQVSHTSGRFFTSWATREAPTLLKKRSQREGVK